MVGWILGLLLTLWQCLHSKTPGRQEVKPSIDIYDKFLAAE
jgi:hypothetical protein